MTTRTRPARSPDTGPDPDPGPDRDAAGERDATPEEMRALGHPLRLRILRLCLDEALTNQELAQQLGRDPGTVLFHVRTLVAQGFLRAEPERPGPRGRIERPYRATGKSWAIRMVRSASHTTATIEAVRDEVAEAGDDGTLRLVRLGVRLGDADIADLRQQLSDLGDTYAARDDPTGTPVGLLLLLHERAPGAD